MNRYIVSYDKLTDVLYILKNREKANRTIFDDDYIAIRKANGHICGITIDGYKERHFDNSWKDDFVTKYFPDFDPKKLPIVENQRGN